MINFISALNNKTISVVTIPHNLKKNGFTVFSKGPHMNKNIYIFTLTYIKFYLQLDVFIEVCLSIFSPSLFFYFRNKLKSNIF